MKIYLDFSVFVKAGHSLGHVLGEVDVSVEPKVGKMLVLPGHAKLSEDVGIPAALHVEHISISSPSAGSNLLVSLESVNLDKAHSLDTMDEVIEREMGLIWNPHDVQ